MEVPGVRSVVDHVADFVFPAYAQVRDRLHTDRLKNAVMTEYVTSLPLQMALYFNSWYAPCWFCGSVIMLNDKYDSLLPLYRIILIPILIVMSMIEVGRLYLGYLGNLSERVPELLGSWLLTLLLQLPLVLFLLLNEGTLIQPLERGLHLVLAVFVLFQIISGYFAIKRMVDHQVILFKLKEFDYVEEFPPLLPRHPHSE